jgi:hypothetical protein
MVLTHVEEDSPESPWESYSYAVEGGGYVAAATPEEALKGGGEK